MDAGKKNERITIQVSAPVDDGSGYGTTVPGWTAFASRIAAEFQDSLPSKSESAANGIRVATQPARVRIGYRTGITSAMRIIRHGATDRTYQIVAGPAEIGRRAGIEMIVELYSTAGA